MWRAGMLAHHISFYHSFLTHSPKKMEQIQSSETSANNYHKPENNPKMTQHSEHGGSLKSRNEHIIDSLLYCSLFTAPTRFNANVPSSGSCYSVPAKLHKHVHIRFSFFTLPCQ